MSRNDGYALARPVPSHEGNGRSSKNMYAQKRRQLRSASQVHLAATSWGGPGSVDETEPIHPLTQRIKAWSRPVEPTVGHRNVATCGLRMTLAQPKAMVKNLVSRAFIESYREPGSRARHTIQHPARCARPVMTTLKAVSPKARCHPSSAMSWAAIASIACASAFREGMI